MCVYWTCGTEYKLYECKNWKKILSSQILGFPSTFAVPHYCSNIGTWFFTYTWHLSLQRRRLHLRGDGMTLSKVVAWRWSTCFLKPENPRPEWQKQWLEHRSMLQLRILLWKNCAYHFLPVHSGADDLLLLGLKLSQSLVSQYPSQGWRRIRCLYHILPNLWREMMRVMRVMMMMEKRRCS